MTASAMIALGLLAQEGPRQTGPDFGKASPFGLIVVVLLLIGTFALVWSMNRHLRRLPESFDPDTPEGPDAAGDRVHGTAGTDPDPTKGNPADGTEREPG
ncbi:MAG TPA: hypothetical protein VEX40_07195 [Mycobacterium sp.]|nr:hypothetical protein [Mycobacterium sp.]